MVVKIKNEAWMGLRVTRVRRRFGGDREKGALRFTAHKIEADYVGEGKSRAMMWK